MTNRFDLEQAIMSVWGTKEDIQLLRERLPPGDQYAAVRTAFAGLEALFDLRMEKLSATFEAVCFDQSRKNIKVEFPPNTLRSLDPNQH